MDCQCIFHYFMLRYLGNLKSKSCNNIQNNIRFHHLEVKMEKYIKSFSKAMLILTAIFFLSFFGGANADKIGMPNFVFKVCVISANALMFVIPLAFVVIFGIGMTALFKKILNNTNRAVVKKVEEKFPVLWYIVSFVCFILYFMFVNVIFALPEA